MIKAALFKSTLLKLSVVETEKNQALAIDNYISLVPSFQWQMPESIELLPSVSLQIGEQDRSGNYWDGYDWRDRWWHNHQGRDLGERKPPRPLLDGHRWQNRGWWKKNYITMKAATGNMTSTPKSNIAVMEKGMVITTKSRLLSGGSLPHPPYGIIVCR